MGFLNDKDTQTVVLYEQQRQIVRPGGNGGNANSNANGSIVRPNMRPRQSEVKQEVNEQHTETTTSSDSFDDMTLTDNFDNSSEKVNLNKTDYDTEQEETEAAEQEYDEQSEETESSEESVEASTADEGATEAKELVLYMIIDKTNATMLGYFRDFGINMSRIFTNLEEAKDTLIMQVNPVKILIVDTGTGRFSAVNARKELIDIMGIVDEDARISVYYTDTVIRGEIKYNEAFESRGIHWHKYRSTVDIVAHLLLNKDIEKYVYDENDKEEVLEVTDDVLIFKGMTFTGKDSMNIGLPSLSLQDIMIHMVEGSQDTSAEIPGYEIRV
jgi:hypothetical protein